jgi:predicted O-linked N-acetylglucosamine transferase (SPINDLY family)
VLKSLLQALLRRSGGNDSAPEAKPGVTDPARLHVCIARAAECTAAGDHAAAAEFYLESLDLQPQDARIWCNFGAELNATGRVAEAELAYRRALELEPGLAQGWYNLGALLQEKGSLDEAEQCYLSAAALVDTDSDHELWVLLRNNLGLLLQNQGRQQEAVDLYRRALAEQPQESGLHSNLLFLYAYHAVLDPDEYLGRARSWEQAYLPAQERQAARNRTFQRLRLAGRRLKLGYVSADYRHHPVSYNIEQVFAHHDRARTELFAYSATGLRDAFTERLQALAEHWIPVTGITDAALRDRIDADGIDVLVDLSGHTEHNRLGVFARRAAPVQVYYLGYFASTGLTEMDYLIGDDILTPPETDSHFSERVWRLPRVWQTYNDKIDAPLPDWRPAQDGCLWLGSFNNLGKLTPATLALWAKVLHALPQATLLLKTKELADAGNRRRILDAMTRHGILPERVELHDWSTTPDWRSHMAYYDRLDIALDAVGGMSGGITTCDALWMGVPVITLEGDRMSSRITATILNAVGHQEWIAHSEADYVDKVVALVQDVAKRTALRSAQRSQMAASPLCDARGLARSLEKAYFEMFERWFHAKN